ATWNEGGVRGVRCLPAEHVDGELVQAVVQDVVQFDEAAPAGAARAAAGVAVVALAGVVPAVGAGVVAVVPVVVCGNGGHRGHRQRDRGGAGEGRRDQNGAEVCSPSAHSSSLPEVCHQRQIPSAYFTV